MKNALKIILSSVLFSLLSGTLAVAEVVTFTKEYSYQASEFDSKVSSRNLALEQVKRLLLEELGTYLISETTVKDFQMTKDQITVFTAGIVKAEVLAEDWDGKIYYLKARVSADPKDVAKAIDDLRQDKRKTKELEDASKFAAEQALGFTMQAPKNWQFREFPGLKYKVAFGPTANSFTPNINVVDEAYDGSLKSYVDANAKALEKHFVQFALIKRDAFVTTRGLNGERMLTTSLQQKNLLRQTFYVFPGAKGKYFVVTCSALAAGGASFDTLFEESIRTFKLIK